MATPTRTDESSVLRPITSDDPESRSADIVAENVEQLRTLFPEAFTEDGIDFDVLKQLLGGAVAEGDEKYGLNWHGKRQARQLALTPSTGTLLPRPEESVDWDTTKNIVIEGDNLEVLKLLQKSYAGKVKLIYIDPPYNTGGDFVYPDDYRDPLRNYLERTGQVDSEGRLNASNPESSGRFHSDWLNMIYPRIKLAHGLLTRDGALFASCDEVEQPRLRLLLDEIFGPGNFVADMVWAAGRKNDSRLVSVSHEYIVCYARDAAYLTDEKIEWRQRKKGLDEIYAYFAKAKQQHGADYDALTATMKEWYKSLPDSHPAKAHKHYSHVDARGIYFPDNISWPGGGGPKYPVMHPRTAKPVAVPSRGWMTSDPGKMASWVADDRVHFGPDESSVPCIKAYLADREYQAPYSVFYQDGRAATKRLRALMGAQVFDFPKDEGVLREIVEMMTSGDDLIVDFFAGSGTTGHAVMLQNAIDGARRRYVLVQLPEVLDVEKDSQREAAEYCRDLGVAPNLAELTKERLRRAGVKIRTDSPMFAGDTGFRVFKLAPSNVRAWNPDTRALPESLLEESANVVPGSTEADLLYEILLKRGLDLTVPIEEKAIQGKAAFAVAAGVLMISLPEQIRPSDVEALAAGIADWHKELAPAGETQIVVRDSAFGDDVAKTNFVAILQQHGLENVRSL